MFVEPEAQRIRARHGRRLRNEHGVDQRVYLAVVDAAAFVLHIGMSLFKGGGPQQYL